MGRLAKFAGGVLSGGVIGTLLGLLFTPESGDAMRAGLRRATAMRWAGKAAGEAKRRELDAVYANDRCDALRNAHPAPDSRTGR